MIPPSDISPGEADGSSQNDPTPTTSYRGNPTADPSPRPAPRHIGRFELRAVLGQGGFGTVYRAYDPQLDREVALKVPRFPPDRPDLMERFLREARAAARLRHPGIVATFEVGAAGGEQFIASELVTGRSLRQRLDAGPPPTVRQAVGWVRDLALALEYAHGQGIIHRDIKPANIMIDAHNRAQLMDFGLAKRVDPAAPLPLVEPDAPAAPERTQEVSDPLATADCVVQGMAPPPAQPASHSRTYDLLTREGAVLGTPAYMSPEQAGGVGEAVGPHSDQYSLGVVLYEVLTGRLPFQGSVRDLLRQVADPDSTPPSPRELNPEVPAPLAAVCLKAMARRPGQRYASIAELAVNLQRWLNGQPVRGYRPPPRQARRERFRGRARPVPAGVRRLAGWFREHPKSVLAALLCLLLLMAGGWWYVAGLLRRVETARHEGNIARSELLRERGRNKRMRLGAARGPERPAGDAVRSLTLDLGGGIKMEFVRIPAGEFMMGKPDSEPHARPDGNPLGNWKIQEEQKEKPPHQVEISRDFDMATYPVTQEQYEAVMGSNPSHFSATGGGRSKVEGMDTRRFPVELVSWDDAQEFCRKLSELTGHRCTLPTEAQWEYACRAGTATSFYFGASCNGTQANCDGNTPYGTEEKGPSLGRTCAVGSYPPNDFGLHDMHGNVCQWCLDYCDARPYDVSVTVDPPGPAGGSMRVQRGGAWDHQAWGCRASFRAGNRASYRDYHCGLRVVCPLDAPGR